MIPVKRAMAVIAICSAMAASIYPFTDQRRIEDSVNYHRENGKQSNEVMQCQL